MRILFTFAGGHGHYEPLAPIARAAQDFGHDVSFACRASAIAGVTEAGFPAYAVGPDSRRFPLLRDHADECAVITPLLALDIEREERDFREYFAGRLARARAAALLERCAADRPDIVVCDETDYGAMVAAESLDLPYASVLVLIAGSFPDHSRLVEPLDALRAKFGLAPDPELEMLARHVVLAPFPPGFREPAHPLPATAQPIRPGALDPPDAGLVPGWLADRPARPLIYLTLGTVFNMESGDLLPRALSGLRDLDADVVVTVGRQLDPAVLGEQPANVHVAGFIPQAAVLPHCDLVVSHGGSGSVVGALAYGVPSVLLPMGADQPNNARRCAELGVALVLDAVAATRATVRDAAAAVLSDGAYRERAARLRAEALALPRSAVAVGLLEAIVG
jgi:UDP:flavonoid glycosyltransferase YjiC (YdhE family)